MKNDEKVWHWKFLLLFQDGFSIQILEHICLELENNTNVILTIIGFRVVLIMMKVFVSLDEDRINRKMPQKTLLLLH